MMFSVAMFLVCVALAVRYGVAALAQGRPQLTFVFAVLGAICLLLATALLIDRARHPQTVSGGDPHLAWRVK